MAWQGRHMPTVLDEINSAGDIVLDIWTGGDESDVLFKPNH